MNLPFYHYYSLIFKNRPELIPLLGPKVTADCCYQEPNWHKEHTTSADLIEISAPEISRPTRQKVFPTTEKSFLC